MKKSILAGFLIALIGLISINTVVMSAPESETKEIKEAIAKYKAKNYLGCISDLKYLTTKDPTSAVGWYYLGSSYMNIAMKPEAHEAFDKVVTLNTVPQLTSYAIQAKLCMENPANCKYQSFTAEQIQQLKADPTGFLNSLFAPKEEVKDEGTAEIEKLINGYYGNYLHPEAKEFVDQQKIKMQQLEINSNRAYLEPNEKIAQTLKIMNSSDSPRAMAMIIENSTNSGISDEAVKLMQIQDSMLNYNE